MSYKLNLEIDFYRQEEASVFLESNIPAEQEQYSQVLLFCNYACRNMYNLGEAGYSLAMALSGVGKGKDFLKEIINYDSPDAPRLVDKKGENGTKRFLATMTYYGSERIANFQLKTKGFGLLARGVGYYSPNSVILLLRYLGNKHIKDEGFLEKLSEASRLCSGAYEDLSPTTEGKITTLIANEVMGLLN